MMKMYDNDDRGMRACVDRFGSSARATSSDESAKTDVPAGKTAFHAASSLSVEGFVMAYDMIIEPM
jgi:hypothetical protein